jgi:heme A synthase
MSRFAKQRAESQSQPQRGLMGMLTACAIIGMTTLKAPPAAIGNRTFVPIILSTSLIVFAYSLRTSMVLPSLEELRRNPRDPKALSRWSRNNLIVLCLCGAVGIMGFATQLLGAPAPISLSIYAIAIAYLFLLRPAKP